MAHTITKQIYCEDEKKYIECEILVLDEEENLPEGTDRREIVLSCNTLDENYTDIEDMSELGDDYVSDISSIYPETELIDQYADYERESTD